MSETLDLISASSYAPVSATVYRVHSSHSTPLIFNIPSLYYPSPLFSYVIDSFVLHQPLFPTVTHTNLNFNFASTNVTLLWINGQLPYIGSKTNRNLLEFFGYEMVLISVNGNAKGLCDIIIGWVKQFTSAPKSHNVRNCDCRRVKCNVLKRFV
jgi:hypothetical protein